MPETWTFETSGKSKNFLPTLRALDVLRDSLSEVRRSFFLKICLENNAVSKIKKMQMIQAVTKGGGAGNQVVTKGSRSKITSVSVNK